MYKKIASTHRVEATSPCKLKNNLLTDFSVQNLFADERMLLCWPNLLLRIDFTWIEDDSDI